ncbi:hypothetical protein E4U03_08030 [Rothia nasimurium]|uniref:Uncharacterized protein n=1 Tax=Rothia nasimurium TaxID=85336 RepID=A0A4Y9F3Y7_9MICC|nr:hypothetical protein [Rothia nasimurium]MBF0808551.1 hypothetical protein [Rothia nasimurium]TFU21851.1 hypothetical protein E4U03_08030 [Rothia nasimurium]
MTDQPKNRRDFDEWDAVFEDSDPTRVLDPRTFGQDAGSSQASTPADAGVSATRYQRSPQVGQEYLQAAPAQAQPPQQVYSAEPATPAQPVQASAYPAAHLGAMAPAAALKRVQFIPAFCGALVAYALATGSLALARTVMGVLGVSTYSGLTETVLAVTAPASRPQALPWLITVAVLIAVAFGLAGYTASRMTALAPSKQAVGVLAVSTLGVLLATLLTWATAQLTHPLAPAYALQPLLTPDLAIGALTALATGVLALVSALIGAGLGTRYHRALTGADARTR